MWFRRGRRFDEVIDRQLDVFEEDHPGDFEEIAAALDKYNRAPADEAEECYSEYADLVELLSQELDQISVRFAQSLENHTGSEYLEAFAQKARRRFRDLPLTLG